MMRYLTFIESPTYGTPVICAFCDTPRLGWEWHLIDSENHIKCQELMAVAALAFIDHGFTIDYTDLIRNYTVRWNNLLSEHSVAVIATRVFEKECRKW